MSWKFLGKIVAIGGAAGFLGVVAISSILDKRRARDLSPCRR
jgi:hypothetical protein